MKLNDLTGRKFGRLLVLERALVAPGNNRLYRWRCLCDCGSEKTVRSDALLSGHTQSCGCYLIDRVSTHGLTKTTEFETWCKIKSRCQNPSNNSYPRYGARGIKVCERWLQSFEDFLTDMGRKPSASYSIERINNDLGYSPDNCIWADAKTQARNTRRNRRIEFDGKTRTVAEWAEIVGVSRSTLSQRLMRKVGLPRLFSQTDQRYTTGTRRVVP